MCVRLGFASLRKAHIQIRFSAWLTSTDLAYLGSSQEKKLETTDGAARLSRCLHEYPYCLAWDPLHVSNYLEVVLKRLNLLIDLVCLRLAAKPAQSPGLPIVSIANASSQAKRRKQHDPYALAQARQRKMANVNRQEELRKEREIALGDPVRGITTPFVESFDTAGAVKETDVDGSPEAPVLSTEKLSPLNHFIKNSELEQSLQHSFLLTQPIISTNRDLQDPAKEAEDIRNHADAHERASAAIRRIVDLANGNQKDRTRFNIQRCIETFGRHNTDGTLRPKAISTRTEGDAGVTEKPPRAGPDTGSSEVQIAILTAKIRVLANHLEGHRGYKDKINKRNLRVLVHRRQKLLAYLRRQERGSERWQYVTETLGLTEGTWKGEISL